MRTWLGFLILIAFCAPSCTGGENPPPSEDLKKELAALKEEIAQVRCEGNLVVLAQLFRTQATGESRLKATVEALKIKLEPAKEEAPQKLTAGQEEELEAQIKALASEDFSERNAASEKLVAAGPVARTLLEKGATNTDAEVAARCKNLLAVLNRRQPDANQIRLIRHALGMDEGTK